MREKVLDTLQDLLAMESDLHSDMSTIIRYTRRRLEAAGIRPISNVVDVTNYVCWELGQPMHAYDRAKLSGTVRARAAQPRGPHRQRRPQRAAPGDGGAGGVRRPGRAARVVDQLLRDRVAPTGRRRNRRPGRLRHAPRTSASRICHAAE